MNYLSRFCSNHLIVHYLLNFHFFDRIYLFTDFIQVCYLHYHHPKLLINIVSHRIYWMENCLNSLEGVYLCFCWCWANVNEFFISLPIFFTRFCWIEDSEDIFEKINLKPSVCKARQGSHQVDSKIIFFVRRYLIWNGYLLQALSSHIFITTIHCDSDKPNDIDFNLDDLWSSWSVYIFQKVAVDLNWLIFT